MNKEDHKNERNEEESGASETTNHGEDAERDSDANDFKLDKDNRGERPDNLRRRSEWFQKRTGGR
jgi:hypothetical protein